MSVSDELLKQISQDVWLRLSGNGSLRIDIDTDVDCYGPWDPHGESIDEQVAYAQYWVEYFVRSTLNRLAERDRDA